MSLCTEYITVLSGPRPRNSRFTHSATSVRRNLFGSAGPANKELCDAELKRSTDEGCRKWNFDFRKEKPLSGPGPHRFEWLAEYETNVRVSEPILSIRPPAECRVAEKEVSSPVEVKPSASSAAVQRRTAASPMEVTRPSPRPKLLKQSRMSDFMKSCKRPASGDVGVSAKRIRTNSEPSRSQASSSSTEQISTSQ